MWFIDKCKCCLKDGDMRDMWSEYVNDGQVEVYGDMLASCFALPGTDRTEYMEKICEVCVEKLRAANEFRQEVITSKEVLDKLIEESKDLKVEFVEADEEECQDPEYEQHESLGSFEFLESLHGDSQEENEENEEMQVEYLEDDIEAVNEVERKYKRAKQKGRKSSYRNYSQDDLEIALQKIMSGKLTRSEAAEMYNIPVKTLGYKIRAREMDNNQDADTKVRQLKFMEEVRTILTFTNVTPFRSRLSVFYCAYCSIDGLEFTDPNELRVHTRTHHFKDRIKGVEAILRPYHTNEILKVDTYNLICTVCTVNIENWNAMFEHLKDCHEVTLDLAYNFVIPFSLQEEMYCALCLEKMAHFHMLDMHMNNHYTNYICGECGDTFLTKSRLNKHCETHSTKQFPCEECGKVFSLAKYRGKHIELVHRKEAKFKCNYCDERFTGEYNRHLHCLDKHIETVKEINCDYCHLTFTWRPYYFKHMRLAHKPTEKKFQCKYCVKMFNQKHELKNHIDWHKGNGYVCDICDKKVSSKSYLQKHRRLHGDTTVFVVGTDNENDEQNE